MIINASMAIRALTEITKDNVEKVYDLGPGGACLYVRDDKPDCGVSHALTWLGVPLEALIEVDIARVDAVAVAQFPGVYLTTYARKVFSAFQVAQDGEWSWGAALHDAFAAYNDPKSFRPYDGEI